MDRRACTRVQAALVAGTVLLLLPESLLGSCWTMVEEFAIADRAPLIVLGEIISIDEATAQAKEHGTLRYLDGVRIRVEKVYKNALSDIAVVEKCDFTAYMHSSNMAVPGTEKKGQRVVHRVSTDLRYDTGTRGIWFVFLAEDGRFYINCHPQQLLRLGKPDEVPKVALGAIGEKFSKAEWAKQGKSRLEPKK